MTARNDHPCAVQRVLSPWVKLKPQLHSNSNEFYVYLFRFRVHNYYSYVGADIALTMLAVVLSIIITKHLIYK